MNCRHRKIIKAEGQGQRKMFMEDKDKDTNKDLKRKIFNKHKDKGTNTDSKRTRKK